MKVRDKLSKSRARAKDPQIKSELSEKYKRYRNMIVTILKQSKKNYYSSYFLLNQSNIKKTWDGTRNLINVSKNRNFTPTKLIYNNETKVSNIDIAESLNILFVYIGSRLNDKIPKSKKTFSFYLSDANNKSIFLKPCTTNEILLLINTMKASKASGPNGFSTILIIQFSGALIDPLVSIINMSLSEGIFPNLLKEARVCPTYKKDEVTKCENYRPISLLSNISKLFERVMYNRLEEFLKSSEVFYKCQFGFRKHYSTNLALISIVEKIRDALAKNMYTCGVFIDLEKAFDTINHQILLSKLYHYGIRGIANKWLSSYLSGRSQSVKLNGITS